MTQPPAPKPEAEPIRDLARAFLVEEYKINRSAIQESTRAISSTTSMRLQRQPQSPRGS